MTQRLSIFNELYRFQHLDFTVSAQVYDISYSQDAIW